MLDAASHTSHKAGLEKLYSCYNRRDFVHPDPLEFLYRYPDPLDREIAGLIASSLAYGRVSHILKSVSLVLDGMRSPSSFLKSASRKELRRAYRDFKHRFTTCGELSDMLWGIKRAIERHGSLQACFMAGFHPGDDTMLPALVAFVEELNAGGACGSNSLLPSPRKGSACKRLNLYLRWMVRRDDVDPGGWEGVPASRLIVPLDTHMYRFCRALGFTRRKQADMRAALEITEAFKAIAPEDPVRYDFAITRLGIRADEDLELFINTIRHNKKVSQIRENQCNPRTKRI